MVVTLRGHVNVLKHRGYVIAEIHHGAEKWHGQSARTIYARIEKDLGNKRAKVAVYGTTVKVSVQPWDDIINIVMVKK